VTATQGFVVSGLLLFFGAAAFVASRGMRSRTRAAYIASVLIGSILVLIGVLWLLLSVAAQRGEG
jgi:TM2 domain-containing membrane protein YozV